MMRYCCMFIAMAAIIFSGCAKQKGEEMEGMGSFAFFASSSRDASASQEDTALIADDVGVEIGMRAPDFDIILSNGESDGRLYDLRGKPVFLNFWATWCGPCAAEMPDIQSIFDKYGEEVNVLALNVGEDGETVLKFAENGNYSFETALDTDFSIQHLYNIQTIPQTFILDEDGIIVEHIQFGANEKLFIDALSPLLEK